MKHFFTPIIALCLSACASVPSDNPAQERLEARATENDRVADMWQKEGNSATSRIYRDKAAQLRAEKAHTSFDMVDAFFEILLGTLTHTSAKAPGSK